MDALSSVGEDLIKEFEALRLAAYQDDKGVWTIGWGHTGPEVIEGLTCTPEQAETWFQEDTLWAVKGVNDSLTTNVTQNQFDALTSFTFNVGVGAEAHSTLLKWVNLRNFQAAAAEFPKWNHVNGVPNAGLTYRRRKEQALFLS